jgi:hypothetical protein
MAPVAILGSSLPAIVLLLIEIGVAACALLLLVVLVTPPYLSGVLLMLLENRMTREPSGILEGWRKRLLTLG